MVTVNTAITRLFDLLLAPLARWPWLGLTAISLVTGGVLLVVFRYTSNQRAIKATKDQILAHLLEVLLYRDEMSVVLRAQARLLRDNLRYLGYALVPLAFMIIPVGFLLVQTDLRYGHRPLRVGERAILAVELWPGSDLDTLSVSAPPGIEVETAALRIPALNEVDWRVRAAAPGRHQVRISIGGAAGQVRNPPAGQVANLPPQEFTKEVVVGDRLTRLSQARVDGGVWAQFLNPGEASLPKPAPARSVTVTYPAADLKLLRWRVHWIWPWLIISMVFGYALKGPLKVQV